MYGILESYIMRRMVVHSLTKNYNNLFTSLIRNEVLDATSLVAKLHSGNDATTYIPTNEELLDGFQKSKLTNLQTRGILYLIEAISVLQIVQLCFLVLMGIAWSISCQRNGETTGPPAPQMKLQSKEDSSYSH